MVFVGFEVFLGFEVCSNIVNIDFIKASVVAVSGGHIKAGKNLSFLTSHT